MKAKYIFVLLTFVSCSKDPVINKVHVASAEPNITDTVLIPLIDMGSKTYLGYHGGLYPDGSNLPSGVYATDLHNIALTITPLSKRGIPNSLKGKVGFIGIGASTCSIMMTALKGKTDGNPLTNPKLVLAACTGGAASVNEIIDTTSKYWYTVNRKLSDVNLNARQVQVVYMETDDSVQTNGFPERPLRTKTEYQQAMRILKIKFSNLKLVYLLGRASAFIPPRQNKITNTEPCPYYNGWACKWVIEDQINGLPGTEYKGANAVSPLVTWGWYEWGTAEPRSDGFTWTEENTSDGLHANEAGADTLSSRFQNFLLTDSHANVWYANHGQ